MAGSVVLPRGLDELVGDLAGDLEDEVEEEQRDVRVERALARGLRRVDQGEEVREEGRPLVEVGGEEEEGQRVREFVADVCGPPISAHTDNRRQRTHKMHWLLQGRTSIPTGYMR